MTFGIEYVLSQYTRPWAYAETWDEIKAALKIKNAEWVRNNEDNS